MPTLNFILTNAGAAAIANVGTLGPVVLSSLAVGSIGYTPNPAQTSLQAQIKTISPNGFANPSSDMIHMTAEDISADNYTCREIGVFDSFGVLFAIYSQANPIFTKTAGSAIIFAFDFTVRNVPPGSVVVGPVSFSYPPATETIAGVAELATQSEVDDGLTNNKIITPAALSKTFAGMIALFPGNSAPTGWLKLNGATGLSRTAYINLWSYAQTSGNLAASDGARADGQFGPGNGSSTFSLPDYRGNFIRGWADGRAVDTGRAIGTLQLDTITNHNHTVTSTITTTIPVASGGGGGPDTVARVQGHVADATYDGVISTAVNVVGNPSTGGGTETRPRNVAALYCIKY
jgi:phage-related tail fiber protein